MGACASCLGRRDKDAYEEDEESRLLYDDANGMQYGSFGDQGLAGENDTLEAQRENEALQRVVAKTSNNMVDIFEIAPQENATRGATTPFAYSGQGARLARYQHLVAKLNTEGDGNSPAATAPGGVKVDWIPEEETIEMQRNGNNGAASIKTIDTDDGPLVGTFADAAAAMQ
ncbi:late endosomal/lysosomal adaptor and MAPK and MTOR activator-domain-containing protein [Mariannaea sp. PMI_226]|nr:late endosomal/lysosomal adaptor and MAPK and MTOR activator-domain-containing protein [Mariannaea sp. PMI_226]